MVEPSWVFALNVGELKENTLELIEIKDRSVLLIKKEDKIYALSNKCKHMVCPLSTGALEGHILRCSCHGWRYDIKTGEYLGSRDITLKVYDNMIKNARTYIYI